MAKKQVDDEIIISALISHKTIREAAETCGISARTIYNKMRDAEFELLYQCARTDVLRGVVSEVTTKAKDALETMASIMHDEDASAQTRLNAANCILSYSERAQIRLKQEETAYMPTAPIESKMLLDMQTL